MLATGIVALARPSVHVLLAEAVVSILLFRWNTERRISVRHRCTQLHKAGSHACGRMRTAPVLYESQPDGDERTRNIQRYETDLSWLIEQSTPMTKIFASYLGFSNGLQNPEIQAYRRQDGVSLALSHEKWQADGKQTFAPTHQNRHSPLVINGVPGGIRTPNLLIRSQKLYPVELQAHFVNPKTQAPKPKL
jgi:hypothetical protein